MRVGKSWTIALCFVAMAGMLLATAGRAPAADKQWLVYEGGDGPGKGKNILFISGDEEYRSEEGLPELAAILAKHHGFHCTVLFALDPKTGDVNPDEHTNIPGVDMIDKADLLVIQTRFRSLPDESMKHINDFLMAGKPVIGLRTATHAFNDLKGEYQKYNFSYHAKDEAEKPWNDGFGRLVLGETWISHHGGHKSESTRGIFAPGVKDSPLLNGIQDGEIWAPTDVYGVRLPMQPEVKPLILGEVTHRDGPEIKGDPFYGMRPTDKATPGDKRNNPMMPVAWTKNYQLPGGKPGKSFTTTMGSSIDLTNAPLRRLLVNATYWLLDMKVPEAANVDIVGDYKPSTFGFGGYQKGKKPEDFEVK